jgi:3-hydroxyisobutyrate dehydrogenase-like beta-hydroxyacid dehydrogenase
MANMGFIGTGRMGVGVAANRIKAGFRLVVTDLDRTRARTLESQGADFNASAKEVAENL